ncbi:hypothetical protein, partial [Bradyrhizobium sp. SZCCHNRI3037]|uniref:hypothetical protein n=1 Tax=Bradyrhizobium sp. SZCCHNRI3037 TaxID=3057290 RepID=UPI002915EF5B
ATALFGSARPGGFAPPSYTTSGDTTSCRSRSSARDFSALRADRPPLPASNARDDRETSLFDRGGMAVDNHEIRKNGRSKFLREGLDRANQFDRANEIEFCAQPALTARDRSSSGRRYLGAVSAEGA